MEDCFEGIICFETLNPPSHLQSVDFITARDDDDTEHDPEATASDCIRSNLSPKSPILCKPSVEAIEAAIRIANVDPQKTVRNIEYIPHPNLEGSFLLLFSIAKQSFSIFFFFNIMDCNRGYPFHFHSQIFFDDSARNIASGKAAGLHTVIVRAVQLNKLVQINEPFQRNKK